MVESPPNASIIVRQLPGGVPILGVIQQRHFQTWLGATAFLWPALCAAQVETNLDNFFLTGTQPQTPGQGFDYFESAFDCTGCHQFKRAQVLLPEPPLYNPWEGSMKANATRDPVWRAALVIANQDAPFSGDLCIRCHAPAGWVSGHSLPTDGSGLEPYTADVEGVTCTVCHRMVDPVDRLENPAEDDPIRNALINAGLLPTSPGSGNYIIDPAIVRRGPFPYLEDGPYPNIPNNLHGVDIIHSPFHTTSEICATCHDVSNPLLARQPDGTYLPNDLGVPHASQDKYDMFPMERTYSEWANSQYATVGVQANGVFGGNHATGIMHTCQDCHMPKVNTFGCYFDQSTYQRPNVPSHDFAGGNTWVPEVLALNPEYVSDTYVANLMDAKDRSTYMLENASTLQIKRRCTVVQGNPPYCYQNSDCTAGGTCTVTDDACELGVRIVNETGHKLPTGYPEGRRMWISVDFRDEGLNLVASRGYYHGPTADLTTSDTKVYEAVQGLDAFMAAESSVPEGPSFHFVLNNMIYKDNRIPPRGFTNAAFQAAQAAPVAAVYADGQYWDDTDFRIPPGAVSATVSVYYQTSSKEYIEFLRDENLNDPPGDEPNEGELLHAQWLMTGMSPPVLMGEMSVQNLVPGLFADADCSGIVGLADTSTLAECLTGPARRLILGCEVFDADLDGDVDLQDMTSLQSAFVP